MKKNNFPGYINIMLVEKILIPYPSMMEDYLKEGEFKDEKKVEEYCS